MAKAASNATTMDKQQIVQTKSLFPAKVREHKIILAGTWSITWSIMNAYVKQLQHQKIEHNAVIAEETELTAHMVVNGRQKRVTIRSTILTTPSIKNAIDRLSKQTAQFCAPTTHLQPVEHDARTADCHWQARSHGTSNCQHHSERREPPASSTYWSDTCHRAPDVPSPPVGRPDRGGVQHSPLEPAFRLDDDDGASR